MKAQRPSRCSFSRRTVKIYFPKMASMRHSCRSSGDNDSADEERQAMNIDRRTVLAGLSATLLAPRLARAATITDATGRSIAIPDKVEHIFAAGPPASILLYTFAPDLLLGWTRNPEPAQCAMLGPGAC